MTPTPELWLTLTVEVFKLDPDPAAPRWKYMARFADGLQPEFPTGRGETVAEAIRVAAAQLEPRAIDA
jgi:hypothetical protein